MKPEFSTPLKELPGFLSTISMVVDDRSLIVNSLIQAERKSPSVYDSARDIFCRMLKGDLDFDRAISSVKQIRDDIERRCAFGVLDASAKFLKSQTPAHVSPFPSMNYMLPNGMNLNLSSLLLRHLDPQRLMVLHLWRKPLSSWQISAAGAVIISALATHQRSYLSCEIDFISVPLPENATSRRFEKYDWSKIKPLSDAELARFWKQFIAGWEEYARKQPRLIQRRRDPDMFDL